MLFMILSRLVWLQLREHEISLPSQAQASIQIFDLINPEGCNAQVKNVMKVAAEYPRVEASQFLWFGSVAFALVLGSSCLEKAPFHEFWIKYHILIFFWTVVINVLLARLLCHNWLIPLFIGTMLFSRGILLARIGVVSYDNILCFLISLWFCAQIHFYRTYFLPSLYFSFILLAIACMFNATLLPLGLPFLLLAPKLKLAQALPKAEVPLRKTFRRVLIHKIASLVASDNLANSPLSFDNQLPLGPLRPIVGPIGVYLAKKGRTKHLLKQWLCCFFLTFLLVIFSIASKAFMIDLDFRQTIGLAFSNLKDNHLWDILMFCFNQPNWHHFDVHFTLSVILCFLVAVIPTPRGIGSLREACLSMALIVFTTNLCFVVSRHFDHAVAQQVGLHGGDLIHAGEAFSHPYIWLEPTILTFGILALFHLLQTIKVWLDHGARRT